MLGVRRPSSWRLGTGLACLVLAATGCAQAGATEQGQAVHHLYVNITLLAAPVFVAVEGLLLLFAFRYRRRDDGPAPQLFGTNRALVAFFAIPTVIVATLFAFGESTLGTVQRQNPSPTVTIRVEGFQWEWTFYYLNEGFFTTGKTLVKPAVMEVPVDEPIHIQLESRDVIHSFFVSAFLFKRDVIPGRHNNFTFTATKLGTFPGQCAEFCGLYHAKMTFFLKVVNEADYLAWVKAQKEAALNVTCPSTGGAISIVAKNTQWNTDCLSVDGGTQITVTVDNQDAAIDHNFAIYKGGPQGTELFMSGRFPGVATRTDTITALAPGRYYFQCDVHGPSMSGALVVNKPAR